jgi:hypothetical protein
LANSTIAARAGARGLVRAVPVWAWLAGLVVVSTAIRYALSRRAVAPWIMVDELIYSELAKSFADTGRFLVRDHATSAYGIVYPALISPAWALFDRVPDAYAAAKTINAFVMSVTVVPAYFLARRVLGVPLALAAAVLTISVPSMVYASTLMTENAFYPVFVAAALAFVAWLERPTFVATSWVLAATAVAYLTRAQALALVPAIVTAPPLYLWLQRRPQRGLRDYRAMYGVLAGAVVLAVIVQVARGASPLGLFGAYEVAGETHYRAWEVFRWFWYHVAELDLSLGIVPFAALVALVAVGRSLDRALQAFLAAAVAISFWLVLEVAAFASEHALRVEERNMFYVAPLFLIALLAWIDRGAPRPTRAAGVGALAAGALPGVLPYTQLIGLPAVSDTPAILPLWSLHTEFFAIEQTALVAVLGSLAAAALWLLVPRGYLLVLPVLVLAYFAVSQKPIEGKHRQASVGSLFAGITVPQRDWIDRAVGRNADVVAIWSGNTDRYAIWENEFFNRSVGTVYDVSDSLGGGLPEEELSIDKHTGIMLREGRPIRAPYALTDSTVELNGQLIAGDERKGMHVFRVNGVLRQTSEVIGLYPQDTWSGPTVRYTRLGCRGGSVTVTLSSDPALYTQPVLVRAFVRGREVDRIRVPPIGERLLTIPLQRTGETCVVRFDVSPTAVPNVVTRGENKDERELGAHFTKFAYAPPA